MIEIFIPILWICVNDKCEFMQSEGYFVREQECLVSLENQKRHMQDLVRRSNMGKITVLEGTCVDAQIKTITNKQV